MIPTPDKYALFGTVESDRMGVGFFQRLNR
jgi:hypothetical protein